MPERRSTRRQQAPRRSKRKRRRWSSALPLRNAPKHVRGVVDDHRVHVIAGVSPQRGNFNREDLAARALLALPVAIRESRGEEILGTLLDSAGTGSRTRFVRELVDLVHTGLRARTAGRGLQRLVADGFVAARSS